MAERAPGPGRFAGVEDLDEPGSVTRALALGDGTTGSPSPADEPAETRAGAAAGRPQVLLLDADQELAEAIPPEDRARAQHAVRADARRIEPGERVQLPLASATTFAWLVLDGALSTETRLNAGAGMVELLLPGDVLSPWPKSPTVPANQVRLGALQDGARVAALDHRFVKAAAVWPQLMVTVHRRLDDQSHRFAVHAAICQLPRIDQRLIAMLWHLAARIGRVTPDGTVVPLPLRHQDLAALVAARRPSVSVALKTLRTEGRLARRDDGSWFLPRTSCDPAIFELGAA